MIKRAIVLLIFGVQQACTTAGPYQSLGTSTNQAGDITPSINIQSSVTMKLPGCTEIGQTWVSAKDGMVLLCIPAGDFLMGSSESAPNAHIDEKPQRRVFLDSYWIDQTEVTNAMFAKCVESGYCHKRDRSPYIFGIYTSSWELYYGNLVYANYPVIMLNADEAGLYCRWAGRRQPTEAEWEKAARGTDGRTYTWGEGIDCQRANYFECVGDTRDVNSYPSGASPYGVLNMAGNLWEWVGDWYAVDAYANMAARNPTGPATGRYHVLRGGAWGSLAFDLRVANRAMGEPEHYYDNQMGIRCAMDASNQ